MAEIAFEYLALALEATRGTAVTPPTHYLNAAGFLTPQITRFRPNESRGTLVKYYRSVATRKKAEWEAEGGLDNYLLPLLLNMLVKPVTSPSTPSGATNARLWSFVPTITSDDIKTATLYWGDPNVQIWQADFATVDELTIETESGSEDGATMSASGAANFPVKVADPTLPAQLIGPLITNQLQVWIDTSSAIGTTLVTGRVIKAKHVIPAELSYKYAGSTDGNYTRIGRGKRSLITTLTLELPDMTEYDHWVASDIIKCRVRHLGPLVESGFNHYVEVDTYGPFDGLNWGDYEGTNRTIELTIESEYDQTLGADWRIAVQNDRTTL